LAARALNRPYDRLKVFHNAEDDLAGLERAPSAAYDEVAIELVGIVAIFAGKGRKKPRRAGVAQPV
jgi:hypothetical protein